MLRVGVPSSSHSGAPGKKENPSVPSAFTLFRFIHSESQTHEMMSHIVIFSFVILMLRSLSLLPDWISIHM